MILRIIKFFYYGYYGAKYCVDYDAMSIHSLIYFHMKRVQKFMKSDKTHLVWNYDDNSKLMRKLDEFVELSKRMHKNELECYYNFGLINLPFDSIIDARNNAGYMKKFKIALKKDNMVSKVQKERYYKMLKHYVPMFWD